MEINKEQGHSLIEVTIAMVILVTAIMGLMGLFNTGFLCNEVTQNRLLAMKAVEEVMEQLKAMDFADLPAQDNLTFKFLDVSLPDPNIGLIRVQDVSGGMGNVYEITVSISQPDLPGVPPFSAQLVSRRAR